MDSTVGTKGLIWGTIGAELLAVVFDLRYMIICSFVLILTDLWWGYSECRMRYHKARKSGDQYAMDKYKWHKSRAIRRSANKIIDYVTYLCCGALIGLAITEPMDICSHVWTAAIGLGLGCACEIASVIGHVAYVRMGVEISMVEGWKAFVRFLGRIIRIKSEDIGEAVEDLGREKHHHHHHYREEEPLGHTDLNHDNF